MPLEIPLELGGGVEVTVHVQLVHVTPGGGESVEWSGTLGPFAVTPGVRSQAVEVPMVRGPPGEPVGDGDPGPAESAAADLRRSDATADG